MSKINQDFNPNAVIEQLKHTMKTTSIYKHTIDWESLQELLIKNDQALKQLAAMQDTGGEPNMVNYNPANGTFTFMDCSIESPKGRRSWCYDAAARKARKNHPPTNDVETWCKKNDLQLLDKNDYIWLQSLLDIDLKTSSWIHTPADIRRLGGALFGDKRYNTVFIYHNGAESYYASRGFRTKFILKT